MPVIGKVRTHRDKSRNRAHGNQYALFRHLSFRLWGYDSVALALADIAEPLFTAFTAVAMPPDVLTPLLFMA